MKLFIYSQKSASRKTSFVTVLVAGLGVSWGMSVCLHAGLITSNTLMTTPFNSALGGTATQSSTLSNPANPVASKAIDGNRSGVFNTGTITHTDGNVPGTVFWQVDMFFEQDMAAIRLWNRNEGAPNLSRRLSNFRLSVLDDTFMEVWGENYHTANTTNVGVTDVYHLPPGLQGRYVRVELLGNNRAGDTVLSLSEVEVYAIAPFQNLALLGTASQLSTGSGGAASRAIDGRNDNIWNNGSISHTDPAIQNNFWEVTLPDLAEIYEIALYNRQDCCGGRLSNFRLSIFNGASEVFGQNYFVGTGSVAGGGLFSVSDDALQPIATGDRVRVQLLGFNNDGNGVISLAEVEVYGVVVPEPNTFVLVLLGATVVLRVRRRTVC